MPIPLRYSALTKEAARQMRREMTPEENQLWYRFLRTHRLQFRRQRQFGRFIVDFYCSEAALVIELDGSQHQTDQGSAYDAERTWYLESLGLQVLRFPNKEVNDNFYEVCNAIDRVIRQRCVKPHPSPLRGDTFARRGRQYRVHTKAPGTL